jgi:Resolvase, N terminal domain
VGRLLFNVLAMVAEFETDLIRMRTWEGMKVAKANGRLRGKQRKLKPNQAKHLLELHDLGTYTQAALAELSGVGRFPIYRTLERMRPAPPQPERPFARLANLRRRAEHDIKRMLIIKLRDPHTRRVASSTVLTVPSEDDRKLIIDGHVASTKAHDYKGRLWPGQHAG